MVESGVVAEAQASSGSSAKKDVDRMAPQCLLVLVVAIA
jgi:hypothetical protein